MFTVFGHRGLPSKAPENTLASFKAASEVEGAQWLELDVGITKDEQLIIIHDDYLERTTTMSGEITQLNYSEMKETSAGLWYGDEFKEERLPTFKQMRGASQHVSNESQRGVERCDRSEWHSTLAVWWNRFITNCKS